jgi:hypothetical protein
MILLPKEHGAYGQVALPLVTALVVAGTTGPALLIASAVLGGFLAHEPALVLLGMRGARIQREQRTRAAAWLALLVVSAVSAVALAAAWLPPSDWWPLLVPAIPTIPLTVAVITNREKTWPAEICASLAFSGAAFPVAVAGGGTAATAATVTTVFAVNFSLATLGVRAVILAVRGGGHPAAARATRRAVLALASATQVALVVTAAWGLLPWSAPIATVPGIAAAAWLVATLPPASQLRRVGWTLMATSAITATILILTLRA